METQSVGLPSISHLDAAKIKREEGDYPRKHSAPAMVSPLHRSFNAPSHPYSSNHQSPVASAVAGPLGGLLSPPESRRTSGDEKDQRQPTRQSLPSIHEALGSEQPLGYSAAPPSAPVSTAPFPPPSSTTSPADHRTRAYSTVEAGSQGPPNPFSHPRSPFMATPASSAPPPPPTAQGDSLPRSSFSSAPHNSKLPSLHPLRTTQSPPPGTSRPGAPYSTYPPPTTSAYESPTSRSAGSMNHHYGYPHSQYPSNYPLSAPPPGSANSAYPPSTSTYSAPPRYPPPTWRSESSELSRLEEKKLGNPSLAPYGESVKRHLESFDMEASLNEMADGSGQINDWTLRYRASAHKHTRDGLISTYIPRLEEVELMIKQSEKIQMSLQRMREVVYNHQQASIMEAPPESHYRPVNGYDHEGPNSYQDEGKGGNFPPDAKKRRGRAAPPGRCHSCNRAETPEWRRGPDGARTLCNACGLHYAKLTRKMGGKNMTSSNLRPKSIGEGSPAA